jgi:hypothetical protein
MRLDEFAGTDFDSFTNSQLSLILIFACRLGNSVALHMIDMHGFGHQTAYAHITAPTH